MIKLINIKSHEQKPFVVLFCMFFSIVATSITGSSVRVVPIQGKGLYLGKIDKLGSVKARIR